MKPTTESPTWYNCRTREVWTKEKQVWCDRLSNLKNSQYTLPDIGSFKLENGKYDNHAEYKAVSFLEIPNTIATGTIGDRSDLTTIILSVNTGGSGIFQYLVVANPEAEVDKTVAATLLGDRVKIQSVTLKNGQIKVGLIQQGPKDPQCCPSEEVIKTYVLENDKLTQVGEVAPGK